MTTANYSMKAAMNAANSFASGLFMGLGMMDAGREGSNYAGLGSFGQTASNAVLGGGRALIDLVTDTKLDNFDIKDLPHILILTWDITCLILKIVGITLETTIPKKILRENPFARDGLYSSMWLIENGLAIGTVTALAVASFKGAIHESVIWLNSNAKITMDSFDYSQKTVAKMDANTAFAGVSAGVAKGVIKEGWKKVLKIVAGVTGGVLGAGAAAGATTAFFTGTVKANEQFEKELRSL